MIDKEKADRDMELERKLKHNASVGADLVLKAIKGEVAMSDRINLANSAIKENNKFMGSKGVDNALKLAVGRNISVSQEELKDYITRNMPEFVEVKKIGK